MSNNLIEKTTYKFGIVGIKRSGLETAKFLLTNPTLDNIVLTIFDDNPDQETVSQLRSINPEIEFFKLDSPEKLAEQRLLIVTPGISTHLPCFDLAKSKPEECQIIGDIELFARFKNETKDPNFRQAKIIGITGSNGKTTVTELTTAIIENLGHRVAKAGNVGIPIFATMKEKYDVYVLELSSFQLETTYSLKLDVGTILNITSDHLDRYDSFEDYAAAKHRIYDFSNAILYNKDDRETYPLEEKNRRKKLIAFSADHEKHASYYYDDQKGTINIPASYHGQDQYLRIPVKHFKLRGKHNYQNILAAIALVREVFVPNETLDKLIIEACEKFQGLDHRYQLVFTSNTGVQFINDSKATNVGSVISAIRSTELKKNAKLYLLLGGLGKNQDFTELAPYLERDDIRVFCYGRDAELCAQANPNATVFSNGTLEQVMKHIAPQLQNNDVVLLSPGCASQDQFKNYEHRGQVFTEIAKKFHRPSRIKLLMYRLLDGVQSIAHRAIYFNANSSTTGATKKPRLYDGYFLALIFSLYTLGIITVFSSSVYLSLKQANALFNYKQAIIMLIGVCSFGVSLMINTNYWRILLPFMIIVTLGALGGVQLIGNSVNGAKRWISLAGFTFQPVELAKFTTFVYLGYYLVECSKEKTSLLRKILGFAIYLIVVCGLLLLQPDFGSTLMIVVVSLIAIVLVTSKREIKDTIVTVGTIGSPFLVAGVLLLAMHLANENYIVNRATGFLNPFLDPYGKSYQIVNSLSAYAHGGLFGTGLGNSVYKSGYLTEANTDYILAIFGEEFGFIGMLGLVILELLIYFRMFKICHESYFIYKRPFQAVTTFIFLLWLSYQSLYNFGMTASFLPTDGSTFPLFSYGGSSYLVTFFALGFVFRADYENRLIAYNYPVENYQNSSFGSMVSNYYGLMKRFFRFKFSTKPESQDPNKLQPKKSPYVNAPNPNPNRRA